MFAFTFLYRELRRRTRQALLIAMGLGLGVGLVVTVSSASTGVSSAQAAVLRSLYAVGAQLTVTEPQRHIGALQDPGGLQSGGLAPFPSASAGSVSHLAHVAAAAGGLQLTELNPSAAGLWTSVSVDGTDVTRPGLGPLAVATAVSGRSFTPADGTSDYAIVDTDYATTNKLTVGSAVSVAGTEFAVIGIVRQAHAAGSADIYIPLKAAQRLARLAGQLNVIYVAADSATHVADVQRELPGLLPSADVTSASDLAKSITGSLQSAATLINDLGTWVALAALIAAVTTASLLTSAAVTRRTRELGTLKALGWSSTRITAQIVGESAVVGTFGAVMGIAAGYAGSVLVTALAPALSATTPQTKVVVHLTADVRLVTAVTAALLAVTGALIAGSLGAWRATRLRPADAFARVV